MNYPTPNGVPWQQQNGRRGTRDVCDTARYGATYDRFQRFERIAFGKGAVDESLNLGFSWRHSRGLLEKRRLCENFRSWK
jgi:hypothetical protein